MFGGGIVIQFKRRHSLAKDDAKREVERVLRDMQDRIGLFGLTGQWEGDTLRLRAESGTAVGSTGEIAIGESTMEMTIYVSPVLRAREQTIEAGIAQFLKRAFTE